MYMSRYAWWFIRTLLSANLPRHNEERTFLPRISRVFEIFDIRNHFLDIRHSMNRIDFNKPHLLLFVNDNVSPF